MLTAKQLIVFAERLLDQQAELLGVADLINASTGAVTLDQSSVGRLSRMDAMQQQAMALAGQERQDDLLWRIKAALIRIDEGEYGDCVECLSPIPLARLEIDPAIECCVNCAGKRSV